MLNHPVVQVAYFVNDAEASARQMAQRFGVGPFFFIEKIQLGWASHRGKEQNFLHSSAYGQWGHVMMELVQQDEEGPSPFRDMYAPGEEGIHHTAMIVDSLASTYEQCESLGLEVATRAETLTGTEFAFIDTVNQMGHMLEVYERSPGLTGFYDRVRDASQGWRGHDPVRRVG